MKVEMWNLQSEFHEDRAIGKCLDEHRALDLPRELEKERGLRVVEIRDVLDVAPRSDDRMAFVCSGFVQPGDRCVVFANDLTAVDRFLEESAEWAIHWRQFTA